MRAFTVSLVPRQRLNEQRSYSVASAACPSTLKKLQLSYWAIHGRGRHTKLPSRYCARKLRRLSFRSWKMASPPSAARPWRKHSSTSISCTLQIRSHHSKHHLTKYPLSNHVSGRYQVEYMAMSRPPTTMESRCTPEYRQ